MFMDGLDNLDQKIVSLLIRNARMSYSEIGQQVGISRVAVKMRVQALEQKGIIEEYTTIINPQKISGAVSCYFEIETKPDMLAEVAEILKKNDTITQIYRVTGKSRLQVHAVASSNEEMEELICNTMDNLPGVVACTCNTILSRIKDIKRLKEYRYTFRYSDIDFNRHVNTLRYICVILNMFPLEFYDSHFIGRFEITFMKETYIDEKDLNMYRIVPAPPKWDLQEYIVTYLKEKDNCYFAWFLHYYEKTLNNNVQGYMRKLFMPEHFADMKQAYIAGLLKALTNYDIEQGAPFTSFKERYVEREILDYVRSMRTGASA